MATHSGPAEKTWMTRVMFYAMLAPALVILFSTAYPFLSGLYISLTNQ